MYVIERLTDVQVSAHFAFDFFAVSGLPSEFKPCAAIRAAIFDPLPLCGPV